LVKAIIGCYAKESAPRTSAEKGSADFSRFLYGIEQQQRERIRRAMIALDSGQIAQAMGRLAAVTEGAPVVIIAGNAAAEKAASDLGTDLTHLPV
jgi:Zn-dependent M16 (insulinase) family peptidase